VRCGHRHAEHAATGSGDYHLQYEQGAFLDALRATRRRQARVILDALRREHPSASALLDFGCGRGWFLDEARGGIARVAGADSSRVAIDLLAERGIPGVHLPPEPDPPSIAAALPYRPDVLTVLDVVEHFPPERAAAIVAGIVGALRPELRAVVVKVPVAGGLLYRTARMLARAGMHGPLEQLYQVGTEPPHRSYFTRASLERCLAAAGLRVTALVGDRDFEPESLAERARPLARMPRPLARLAGGVAATASAWLRMPDSVIAVARVE
jgi:2-polyprenyl-3-methyl-5-hydroxy-6-metoxy-1,4-benzoquinol methylase